MSLAQKKKPWFQIRRDFQPDFLWFAPALTGQQAGVSRRDGYLSVFLMRVCGETGCGFIFCCFTRGDSSCSLWFSLCFFDLQGEQQQQRDQQVVQSYRGWQEKRMERMNPHDWYQSPLYGSWFWLDTGLCSIQRFQGSKWTKECLTVRVGLWKSLSCNQMHDGCSARRQL